MFELYKKYHFEIPAGVISESGIREIERYIRSQDVAGGEWKTLNPENARTTLLPTPPVDWEWTWLVTGHGDYVGTLPKRLAKFYFKVYGLKCPDAFIAQIGNLAKAHSESQEVHIFEFVNRIDWESGDFGDSYSCFWGEYAGAKLMITDNGGMAIRFFTASGHGYGRAWLIPVENDLYIIFNGYGFNGDATLVITRIFASFINAQYKQISLDNRYGGISINGNAGYIVGRIEDIDGYEDYEFDWEAISLYSCCECGRELDEYDIYRGADDRDYCDACFSRFFGDCFHCGEPHHHEDLTYLEDEGRDVCHWCLRRYYSECYRCEDYHRKENTERFGKQVYCPDCAYDLKMEGDNIE